MTLHHLSQGFMYIMPALLILAIGTSIAPVAGGFQDGWVKYSSSNVKVPAIVRLLAGAHPGKAIPIQIWVGWIRSHNTLSSLINTRTHGSYPKWLWDKDVQLAGFILAVICCAALILSAAVCLAYLVIFARALQAYRRVMPSNSAEAQVLTAKPKLLQGLWIVMLVAGSADILFAVLAYIILAIGLNMACNTQLKHGCIGWPDWAFFLAVISGCCLFVASILSIYEQRRLSRMMGSQVLSALPDSPAQRSHSPKIANIMADTNSQQLPDEPNTV